MLQFVIYFQSIPCIDDRKGVEFNQTVCKWLNCMVCLRLLNISILKYVYFKELLKYVWAIMDLKNYTIFSPMYIERGAEQSSAENEWVLNR